MMFGKVKVEIVEYDFYCWNDVVEVQQWFVYVYYYYVGNGMYVGGFYCVDDFCCVLDLVDNFGYLQVVVKVLLGGGVEFVFQCVVYLGGDVQGGVVFFWDIDGFDVLIVNGNCLFNGFVG